MCDPILRKPNTLPLIFLDSELRLCTCNWVIPMTYDFVGTFADENFVTSITSSRMYLIS
jgi:hypothetical protein